MTSALPIDTLPQTARTAPRLAVLIDADNVPAKHAPAILHAATQIGDPAVRRVYGDWSNQRLRHWRDHVRDLGLSAHQEDAHTTGKNSADIGLVIDAMDLLHAGHFDGFVLVSSDSDFTALANRLREAGRKVYGMGETKTPRALRQVCNRFVQIEDLAEQPCDTGTAQATAALPHLQNAMAHVDPEGGWYSLGQIGQTLHRIAPDFDSRQFGHAKLSTLVAEITEIETRQDPNQLMLRLRA